MNLVIVTSIIRPVNDITVFKPEQRINQTKITISSLRDKIPNVYIVMLEGGNITTNEENLFGSLVDELHQIDVRKCHKSQGEVTLLYTYLTSKYFNDLENIQTISKMSGRYYLTKDFNWYNMPYDNHVIDYVPKSWRGVPCYNTRYYRFPYNYVNTFVSKIKLYLDTNENIDVEHFFYKADVVDRNKVFSPKPLGIFGYLTRTAAIVKD